MTASKVVGLRVDIDTSVTAVPAEVGQSLKMLQAAVGGYVDVIRLGEGIDLWVNDEAWLGRELPNLVASSVVQALGGTGLIVGPVVFASATEDGETVSLSRRQLEVLVGWLAAVPSFAAGITAAMATWEESIPAG